MVSMNPRSSPRPGAHWRERFVAIAHEAQAALARPHGRSRVGIRPRLAGAAPERRFAAPHARS
jgi:hypothetical protein